MIMIKYKSDKEFVQACHDSGMVKAAVAKRLDNILEAHRCMVMTDDDKYRSVPVPCKHVHAALVADVLKYVATELMHIQASDDFVFNREVYEGDRHE